MRIICEIGPAARIRRDMGSRARDRDLFACPVRDSNPDFRSRWRSKKQLISCKPGTSTNSKREIGPAARRSEKTRACGADRWLFTRPVRHPFAGFEFSAVARYQIHSLKRHPIANLKFPAVTQNQLLIQKRHPNPKSLAKRVAGELFSRPLRHPFAGFEFSGVASPPVQTVHISIGIIHPAFWKESVRLLVRRPGVSSRRDTSCFRGPETMGRKQGCFRHRC